LTFAFTYNPIPNVSSISPDHGSVMGGTSVVITGTNIGNFSSDVQSVMIGQSPCTPVSFSNQQLTCTTSASGSAGAMPVVVTTFSGGSSNANVLYIYAQAPYVETINPLSGPQDGGTTLSIGGESNQTPPPSFFSSFFSFSFLVKIEKFSSSLKDFGSSLAEVLEILVAGIECEEIEYISSSALTCVTEPSPNAGRGPVLVTTLYGEQGTSAIEYTYNLSPYLNDITPTSGPESGGTSVTITGLSLGTDVDDIQSVTIDGNDCLNIDLIFDPENMITCVTSPKLASSAGVVQVTTYSGGVSNRNLRYTYNPAPITADIDPTDGPEAGGSLVTITGTNLGNSAQDILDVTIAGASCVATLIWNSSTLISCITTARIPQTMSGPVIVTTTSGGVGSNSQGAVYSYNYAPLVTDISPDLGHSLLYTTVTITGSYLGNSFDDILDVTVAGETCLFSLVYRSPSTIMCMINPYNGSTSGQVNVITRSGGVGKSQIIFVYQMGCSLLPTAGLCEDNACYWCEHVDRCLDNSDSCVQSMTASTVSIVLLTTTALASIITAIFLVFHFANRDDNLLRDLKSNKLGMPSRRAVNSDTDTDSDAASVVVERFEGETETIDVSENE